MLEEELDELEPEEVVEDVGRIRRAGLHLLSLVNDVLDMAKIEAGHTELHVEEFELQALLAAVVATMAPLVNDRRNDLRLTFRCAKSTVRTDLVKLRQCVINLVSNANKFTEQGHVEVQAIDVATPEGEEGEWIEIRIVDTGIGMSEEELQGLFQPFVQADASTTRRFGGTGLGLHISQRLCEVLGGKVLVQSSPGEGSVFSMLIPRVLESEGAAEPVEAERSMERGVVDLRPSVLLIDDDREQHNLIARELEKLGYDLIAVEHGAQGLARMKVDRPDLILLDILMPGMDGWTVLEAIASDPATMDIPVVMLSVVDDHGRAVKLGAKAFLDKPVRREQLGQVLQQWCPTLSMRVMLVGGEPSASLLVKRTLELARHQVQAFRELPAALEELRRGQPDLLLLDFATPGMDLFEFLDLLRGLPKGRMVSLVITTTGILDGDERTRLQHAAAHVVSRDAYSTQEVIEVVAQQLALRNPSSADSSGPEILLG
jgi:CheY-like chemotaxis protein/two-component sensor histidine kinase